MAKIVPKRTTLLQKLAYIVRPFVVYMLVKNVVMFLLAIAVPSLPITGMTEWVERNANQLSAAVNSVASLVAVGFLLNDFLIEASTTGEVDIDNGVLKQFLIYIKNEFNGNRTAQKIIKLILCVMLGITASLAFNILIELMSARSGSDTMLGSEKYEVVETIQYSVPIWLGIVLYGIISPVVEEIVFRGVIFNRIRKFYSVSKAVIFSALLFGMFHANLPQFLYGTVMGMLMALCYAYTESFAAPVLLHMSANIFVFLISGLTTWSIVITTPVWCTVFMGLSIVLLFLVAHTKPQAV
ncbi:MAG: CPBP family intramembrane metalloprotease [Lachnospiraceae bacterium]|nr:CPBP family intramembrane metalloprotease [Lachnospiraceae bacterium]